MYWYDSEINRLTHIKSSLKYEPKTYFYGSSSFTQWHSLYEDFKDRQPINLGFGGSTLAACTWFFDRVFSGHHPESILIYAGDNDLGDNRHPEEVFIFFQQLVAQIRAKYGDIPLTFLSIKPSLSRWHIIDRIKFTNKIIEDEIYRLGGNLHYINIYEKMIAANGFPKREYFELDGLHLSRKGYKVWHDAIESHYAAMFKKG